jgi:magnesium transporter
VQNGVVLVDAALYRGGERVTVGRLADLVRREFIDDEFVWVGLHDPTDHELREVADVFELHPLALEDMYKAGQQPKVERYGDTMFVVLRSARYLDEAEVVEFGEIQLFATTRYVLVIRRGTPAPLAPVRARLEADTESLRRGPIAVVHAVLDTVVDHYAEVLAGLDNDVSEVEAQVFADADGSGSAGNPVGRIYFLRREVLELHRAMLPMLAAMPALQVDPHVMDTADLHEYFRDVEDHLSRHAGQLHLLRELLADALEANATQVNLRQNADMRMISAWVAIAAVPTVLGAIYGMNFRHMPELDWRFSYPLTVAVILLVCAALYRRFRRVGWL